MRGVRRRRAVLEALEGKDVMLGVIDVGTEEVETPEMVAERIRNALPYVTPRPPVRLHRLRHGAAQPRGGLGKMRALAAGAAIVNRELTCVAGEVSP